MIFNSSGQSGKSFFLLSAGLFGSAVLFLGCEKNPYQDWKIYGGGYERLQYSGLGQINTENVKDLQVEWMYHTRDADSTSQIQVNPVIVDDILYGVSPQLKLFALDAGSGKEHWVFDPALDTINRGDEVSYGINACRGVTLYENRKGNDLVFYTVGAYLYCIDSKTGRPVATFGRKGKISLHDTLDLTREVRHLRVTSTTPGIIYKDLIIVGTSLSEGAEAAPGHIRAYNVHSGKIEWIFHTIPQPGQTGHDSWEDPEAYRYVGGANAWGGFSLDEQRGWVFAATGTSNPDYYGAKRKGNNLFADCVLALDAATGELKWHFQTIHHDLWDWDLPTAPVLASIVKDGKKREAVVQVTKHGMIFVLDRQTGEPLYPVEERPVPAGNALPGDQPAPTQPFPTFFAPFVRHEFTEDMLYRDIPEDSYQDILQRFRKHQRSHMFTPPGLEGTIVFPGLQGGAEWGGPSFDPGTGMLYINANEVPWIVTMKKTERAGERPAPARNNLEAGKDIYANNCKSCHGASLAGNGNFPPLLNLEKRYDERSLAQLLSTGRRMMPAFNQLSPAEVSALASFLLNLKEKHKEPFYAEQKERHPYYDLPYELESVEKFLTKEGYPAVSPPWGTLTAINTATGKVAWKNALGDHPGLEGSKQKTGAENMGGSVVTAGGLLFIAATPDKKIRAFDKLTGELLFEAGLPAAAFATPSLYSFKGRQYVVVACGGGKMNTRSSDVYVAFSLPAKSSGK